MNKEAIIIFLKYPELGRSKTRLAKVVGNVNALKIYRALLDHTHLITKDLTADRYLFYDRVSENRMPWDPNLYFSDFQTEGDLGNRMQHAFDRLLAKGYERVIIIGSDCYELTQSTIENAFKNLSTNDVVIGPAKDGGYYLLGLTKRVPQLFSNIPWSTEQVFNSTIGILEQLALPYHVGSILSDIDTIEDLPPDLQTLLECY